MNLWLPIDWQRNFRRYVDRVFTDDFPVFNIRQFGYCICDIQVILRRNTLVILAEFSPSTWAQIFQRISNKELKSLRFTVW